MHYQGFSRLLLIAQTFFNIPELMTQTVHNLGSELFEITTRFGVLGHLLVSHLNNYFDDLVTVAATAFVGMCRPEQIECLDAVEVCCWHVHQRLCARPYVDVCRASWKWLGKHVERGAFIEKRQAFGPKLSGRHCERRLDMLVVEVAEATEEEFVDDVSDLWGQVEELWECDKIVSFPKGTREARGSVRITRQA